MKNKILVSSLFLAGAAFAASNTFKVSILEDSMAEGKTIKAGDYKVSMENGNAILKNGKEVIELPAHQQTSNNKVAQTELLYKDGNNLLTIRIGGTATEIVFDGANGGQSGM